MMCLSRCALADPGVCGSPVINEAWVDTNRSLQLPPGLRSGDKGTSGTS